MGTGYRSLPEQPCPGLEVQLVSVLWALFLGPAEQASSLKEGLVLLNCSSLFKNGPPFCIRDTWVEFFNWVVRCLRAEPGLWFSTVFPVLPVPEEPGDAARMCPEPSAVCQLRDSPSLFWSVILWFLQAKKGAAS